MGLFCNAIWVCVQVISREVKCVLESCNQYAVVAQSVEENGDVLSDLNDVEQVCLGFRDRIVF